MMEIIDPLSGERVVVVIVEKKLKSADGLNVMSAEMSRENRRNTDAQSAARLTDHSPPHFTDGAVTHRAFALCLTALLPRRVKL